MPKPLEDLTGRKFGKLKVLCRADRQGCNQRWKCYCECGNITLVQGSNLRSGHGKSCGCIGGNSSHRKCYTTEYHAWEGMKARCTNSNNDQWEDYGGRGITYCQRWRSFENFLEDMGEKPRPEYTLERKNVDGNYTPQNCIWATRLVQNNNKRTNRKIAYDGRKLTAAAWSRETGIPKGAIFKRFFLLGWAAEKALFQPVREAR
jgi:hypothetical protein